MKNLPTITRETVEVEIEDFDQKAQSGEQKVKAILNAIILLVPTYDERLWHEEYYRLTGKTIGGSNKVAVGKFYKVAIIEKLFEIADNKSWFLAKSGNQIYIYNGQFWIEIDPDDLMQFLKTVSLKLGVPKWLSAEVDFIKTLYKQFFLSGFFEKMIQPNETLLNLNNGTLKICLDGIKLSKFNPADFLTSQLDFNYEPKAKNQLWLDFLDEVLPDKETQKTLQQALGYLFIQDLKLEKAIFLYGTGSNGKSVVFEVLRGILSNDMMTNYSLESLCDSKGYHRSGIHNKLINYGTDITMSKIDHGMFKQLISGEPIEVRQIYEKPFIMKKYAKLIFNLNKIDDADVETTIGFFRRMIFIPFETRILPEKQDKNLHKKILSNKAGILNWILDGVQEVLNNEEIFISKQCNNFLEKFQEDSNLTFRFVDEYEISKSYNKTIPFQELYQSFLQFCKDQGEKPFTQRNFNSELKKLGFNSVRRNGGNVWFATRNCVLSA